MFRSVKGACACLLLLLSPLASADFQAGLTAYQKGDYTAAIEAWEPLAAAGDTAAQFNLGSSTRRRWGSIVT